MLMCTSCQMNFDRAFFGKEIWACIEIDGLLVNFHQKKGFFYNPFAAYESVNRIYCYRTHTY